MTAPVSKDPASEQCPWQKYKSRIDSSYPLSRPDGGRGYTLVQQCVKTKDHRGDHQFPDDPYDLYSQGKFR